MKKLIYSMAALATMLFASCQQQELPEPVPQESTVTYTVELPGVQTKAIGDGTNINQLVYEVWKTEADNERDLKDQTRATRLYQKTVPMIEDNGKVKTIISLNLVQDQSYTVLFWAQCVPDGRQSEQGASKYYNTDNLTAVTYKNLDENDVPVNYLSNNEDMAAFYSADFLTLTETDAPNSKTVELRRPFAQLNIATKNTSEEYKIDMKRSTVTISYVPTVFDVAWNQVATPGEEDGVSGVINPVKLVFGYDNVPSDPSKIIVNKQEYEYVAMNYIFASNTVTVEYNIEAELTPRNLDGTDGSATTKAEINNTVINVPLKENYRTNIVGNLLTHTTDYEVIVDAGWDDIYDEDLNGDGIVEEVWDQKYVQEPYYNEQTKQYEVSLASELAWLAAAVNGTLPETKADTQEGRTFSGETFVLKEDIDLDGALWNPIGSDGGIFMGTFDGNNKTISNLTVATEGNASAGLFGATRSATIKNVKVVNATITGHYKTGVIVGDGLCARIENCHVDGATVTVTPYEKDDANNVGGIVGYLAADGGTAYAKNCSVKDATITAYRKVGGLVGAANGAAEVSGNIIENVKVTADMTQEYMTVESAHAGLYAGYKHADAVLSENNKSENDTTSEVKVLVDSAADINGASDNSEKVFVFLSDGELNFTEAVDIEGSIQAMNGTNVTLNVGGNDVVVGTNADYGFISNASTLVINDANIKSNGGAIAATDGAKVTFNSGSVAVNATTTAGRYNVYAVGEGTEVTINGGVFSFNKPTNKRAYIYVGAGAKVYVTGGTFGKASTRSGYTAGILGDGEVYISGGTFGFDPTQWVAAGYTAMEDESTKTWSVVSLSEPENLKAAVSVPGATVKMAEGTYTFPSSSIAEGVTIECEEGTVFTGTSKLNIKGSTIIGATFSNPEGTAADQTINGTFKNCTFEGRNGLRWAYAGETVVFEDCVFDGDVYGAHFDGGANDIIFRRCTFSGFNAFGGAVELVTFDDCTFVGNGKSSYNGANLWGSTKMINTKFVFDGSTDYEWVDCISSEKNYEFTGCTICDDGSVFRPELISSSNAGTKATIDGNIYTWTGSYFVDANGNTYVTNVADLQTVVNNAPAGNTTINILNDLTGDVVVPQSPNVLLTIEGADHNYMGVITVDGKSATYTTAGLTIKDLTFNAQTIFADACIRLGDGTNATRYTCNVKVDNCVFDVPVAEGAKTPEDGAVGVKSYTGGDKNLMITGCTATENAHSLVQATGIDKILIQKCKLYSKNGMNFNQSTDVEITDCTADVKGYAARFGASSGASGVAETYSIKTSTLKSACEDGDAVIMLRGTADKSTLTITNTTLEGTTPIANNAVDATIIIDGIEQ